jgi:hypothetical protein
MSVAPPSIPPNVPSSTSEKRQSLTIVSHSNLFYWWPVWAIGFLMALLSFASGERMAVVPAGTKAFSKVSVQTAADTTEVRDALVLPPKAHLRTKDSEAPTGETDDPHLFVANNKSFGVLFAVTLLLVIIITNVPLRGMWSMVVIMLVVLFSVIFALAGWWERILYQWSLLDIRINAGGYLFISTVLFGVWLGTMLIFDKQIYMVFTPGNFKVCTEIGGGEKVYDTMGMTLERQRSDLFRHWVLGLGSGDLIVKTSGAQAHQFDLPNVLFIGRKVQMIEQLLKTKQVLEAR